MTVEAWSPGRPDRGGPRSGGSRGRADLHLHSLYSDGTASVAEILDHVEGSTDLDVVAITDHERIDGALRAAELHRARGYSFDLVVGEEITTRRGHVLALFVTERIPALRPLEETLERIHGQGGIAIAAHPMAPIPLSVGRRSLQRVRDHADEAVAFDALELFNPSHAGRTRHSARMELNARELNLPGVGNSDAHVLEGIGTGWTAFPGYTALDYRAAIADGEVSAEGTHWSSAHNVDVYRRQLHAKLRHLWHTVRPGDQDWR
ncbi:MAG TPA: PHP-associated domain-containing protein [Candidatus Limnocylindria bacterium]|nr:PHP-associated domain-containing protein [Candidatus Limnocylindria bacterium]